MFCHCDGVELQFRLAFGHVGEKAGRPIEVSKLNVRYNAMLCTGVVDIENGSFGSLFLFDAPVAGTPPRPPGIASMNA